MPIESGKSHGARVWLGGSCNDQDGYFVMPTVAMADNVNHALIREEVFGPVLTLHLFADDTFADILQLCNQGSSYALTGAIFAQDRKAIAKSLQGPRFAAGNFYINDKPTGAVVGQQSFGGSRASGTNDKAGSALNLLRWTRVRATKENFGPPHAIL